MAFSIKRSQLTYYVINAPILYLVVGQVIAVRTGQLASITGLKQYLIEGGLIAAMFQTVVEFRITLHNLPCFTVYVTTLADPYLILTFIY
jgi:hypothetical protein